MYKKIMIGMICISGFLSYTFSANRNLPGVTLITRTQRGADESRRYSTTSKTERDMLRQQQAEADGADQTLSQGQIATDYLIEKTPNEQIVDEYRESSNGHYLKRPESIHYNKNKIIIHHTADDYSALLTGGTGAVIQELQDIYKYHTLTKGRGDIGYNFIIDPFGNIYEGRAGGAGVVGAHVSRNNTPSVGVSLMGNFNADVPTDASLKSLTTLLTALAKKYKINPKATATYFKASSETPYLKEYTNYTIAGHTDAGATACPGTNLYTLLPEIRDQVSKNLTKISLVRSPIIITAPSTPQGTIVAGRYYSSKTTDTFLLPIRRSGVISCTSVDASVTVNSCTSRSGGLSLSLTRKGSSGIKTFTVKTASGTQTFSMNLLRQYDLSTISDQTKQSYMSSKNISPSSQSLVKISSKISLSDLISLIETPVMVLLYELSTDYPRYEISCDGGCAIQTDTMTYTGVHPIVETSNGFIYLTLPAFENALETKYLEISSIDGGLVHVDNYTRKSYGGIPRNTFRGSLIRKKDTLRNLSAGKYVEQAVVINKTSFDNYMQGIAETSDSDAIEKQKTVLLLAKMYTLFYINGQNSHPSIPTGASYQAIDNPDMFQKYVGAGREKTSKMSVSLLSSIQNTVVLYDDYVPILPYFSCSAGFTRSAREKRGWTDTPYLQSRLDFAPCFDFSGHGVGLSGKGAQYLAEKGWTMQQILQYYYPGVELTTIN